MYFAVQGLITAATKVFHTKAIWKIITSKAATGGVLGKKDVLINLTKFTGKHLC